MYIVTFKGPFGFIKPWTAVRDGETFSQQFLTPSIIEGIEKKLFPELLSLLLASTKSYGTNSVARRCHHSRRSPKPVHGKNTKKSHERSRSIINRDILVNPVLRLAFTDVDDAMRASRQHVCLCRNEDVMLPEREIKEMDDQTFSQLPGFELRIGQSNQSFLVGFNRFDNQKPMYGWIEYNGISLTR